MRGDAAVAEKKLRAVEGSAKVRRATPTAATAEHVTVFDVSWKDAVEDTALSMEQAVAALVGAGLGVREALPGKATLEEVFAQLTEDVSGSAEPAEPDQDRSQEDQP